MADWIRADNANREWPAGAVIIYYGRGQIGKAWRDERGVFKMAEPLGDAPLHPMVYRPSHFFYLPAEPDLQR